MSWRDTLRRLDRAKLAPLFILLLLLTAATFVVPTLIRSPEERFWRWFAAHEAELFDTVDGTEALYDELQARLNRIDRDLTYLIGPIEDERREFFVSAEGRYRAIPAVQRVVAAAPALEQWEVVAFRPKLPTLSLTYQGITVDPRDVVFTAGREGGRVGISVFLPDAVAARRDAKTIAWLILDGALGEYDLATKVGSIAVFGRSEAEGLSVLAVDELSWYIDWRLSIRLPGE
jgi:hypothetical protein